MKITFLGAAETVTGSRILFEHRGYKGLVDCGLFQGPKEFRLMNWVEQEALKGVQSVLLTHVHVDHSGYLPRLYKNGFRGQIYCTEASASLLPIMLVDAAKLQEEDARFANESKYSNHNPAEPLYDLEDAKGCQTLIYSRPWHEWQQLTPDLSFRFSRSGHILGSGVIQMSYKDEDGSKVITFSGDLGSSHSDVLRDAENILSTDALVIESTYGNRILDRTDLKAQMATVINQVFSRGGSLIIPAFSVGRTQDLLLMMAQLRKSNQIPKIPVCVDSPMSQAVTGVYFRHLEELKQDLGNTTLEEALAEVALKPVLSTDDSMLLCMSDEPKIVITASGMLQGGRVLHHLRTRLPNSKNGVLFVGFQSKGTKGRLLKEGIRSLRIHHREVDVEAEIFSIEGLSAHADANELIGWMSSIQKPPFLTLINHGEIEASEALKLRIENELKWPNVVIPKLNETIDLSHFGDQGQTKLKG